jgi:hypothetical protein
MAKDIIDRTQPSHYRKTVADDHTHNWSDIYNKKHTHNIKEIAGVDFSDLIQDEFVIPDYHEVKQWSFTGVKLWDTDATHELTVIWNEDSAADYQLGFLVSGGNRDVTVEADAIISQDYSKDSTDVRFANLHVGIDAAPDTDFHLEKNAANVTQRFQRIGTGSGVIDLVLASGGDLEFRNGGNNPVVTFNQGGAVEIHLGDLAMNSNDITGLDHIFGLSNAVGDPTYSFTSDTDTGIYYDSAIAFAFGGTKYAQINASGVFLDNVSELTGSAGITFNHIIKANGGLVVSDGGYIGSASDTDAIQIEADGDIIISQDLLVSGTLGAGQATITKMNLGGGITAFVLNGVSLDAIVGATSQIDTEMQYVALQHSNTALAGSRFMLSRSRGTLATPLVVAENDVIAAIDAAAYDGTDYVLAGQIDFEVDGTPGGNDMPGRIVLKTTADGAVLPTTRWTVKSTGHLLSGADGTGAYNITTAGEITAATVSTGILDNDDSAITVGDNLTRSLAGSGIFTFENTEAGATENTLGEIYFSGKDASGNQDVFAKIIGATADDITHGTEEGQLLFYAFDAGVESLIYEMDAGTAKVYNQNGVAGQWYQNNEAGAVSNQLGDMVFRGKNADQTIMSFAEIIAGTGTNITAGAETGELELKVARAGSLVTQMKVFSNQIIIYDQLTMNAEPIAGVSDLYVTTINERVASADIGFGDPVYWGAVLGDKISLYANRLNATNMYGFGLESGYTYAKGATGHRWYCAANADGGTSDIMELNATHLTVHAILQQNAAIYLTQTDGNEYIDSLNDNYVDVGATTAIRLNQLTKVDHFAELTGAHGNVFDNKVDVQGDIEWGTNIGLLTSDTGEAIVQAVAGHDLLLAAGATEYVKLLSTGPMHFLTDAAGLPYSEIYAHAVTDVITSVAQNDWDQIVAFNVNGESLDAVADHTNDHITIATAGRYLVTFVWCGYGPAAAHDWDFHIGINNGATKVSNISGHQTTPTTQKTENTTAVGILDLAASDTVELWVQRTSAGNNIDLTTVHCSVSVVHLGGT